VRGEVGTQSTANLRGGQKIGDAGSSPERLVPGELY
jgi:hypothetical protein